MAFSALFLASTVLSGVYAANDWSQPCISGSCSYDIPTSNGTSSASGTIQIWGSNTAISDITTAAGWEILGCSPNALSQDIRLVCKDDAASAAQCAHLFSDSGPEGKIVRLPQNCNASPFARVARAYVPDDQSIPATIAARVIRRDGNQPQVKALQLDTNFAAVDVSKYGPVNFALQGANVPGAQATGNITATPSRRSSRIYSRGIGDFFGGIANKISSLDSFDVNKTIPLPPVDVDQPFNLVDQSISCPPITASLKVDVDAKAHAVAAIGAFASGTVIPPKISDFGVFSTLTADLNGTIDLKADIGGTLDSGKIKIFEVGIPGLDFPGILSVGPSFVVNAQAKATLDLNVDMTVGVNYHIDQAKFVFPPNSDVASGASASVGDTPLKLSLSPAVKATGTLEAHLIPTLNLGISALGADATVFLDLDASTSMKLSLEAQEKTNVTIDNAQNVSKPVTSSSMHSASQSAMSHPSPLASRSDSGSFTMAGAMANYPPANQSSSMTPSAHSVAKSSTDAKSSSAASHDMHSSSSKSSSTSVKGSTTSPTTTDVANHTMSAPATTSTSTKGITATKDSSTSFGGCFEIDAGLALNVGANADFFGLFNPSTTVPLLSKNFELFKKCFGSQPARRRSMRFSPLLEREAKRALKMRRAIGLVCPLLGVGAPQSVVSETIAASAIKAVA